MKTRNMTSIYLIQNDHVLLLFRQGGRVVNEAWTGSAGGHFEETELNDPEACVLRELYEELGVKASDLDGLKLRYITLRRSKSEVRQDFYFFAELKNSFSGNLASNEGISKWFSLEEIGNLNMPYSARYMIDHYLATGRFTDELYVGVADGEAVRFTELPEY